MTSGDSDLSGQSKHRTATTSPSSRWRSACMGNVRTRTARAWPMEEFQKLVAELP